MTNVILTPAAAKFMTRMVRFSGEPDGAGFRLQVSAGGCSGFNSEFTVEAAPQAGDAVVDVDGVRMFLPAESRLLLEGVTIDFADTPTKSGLTFINPNQAACACSSSSTGAPAAHGHANGHGHGHAMPGVVSVGIDAIRRN
ncbi:MAG TPA: iron-sulfur cluster assembly accessory protein [Methyloversatilis sp.]